MLNIPNKIGTCAFGVKTGAILPGDDIIEKVYENVKDLVDNNDIICVTEAVVAISQKNYITIDTIATEIRKKLNINEYSSVGVIYPIASRNRFSLILKGIAKSVEKGKITIQFSYPNDEVGNPIIREDFIKKLGKSLDDKISMNELEGRVFPHPFTGVDYISLYDKIIKDSGAKSEIFLCNNAKEIINHNPNGIIVSSIHSRKKIKNKIQENYKNCITLQEICNDKSKDAWSEWGLLGSNMVGDGLKLAPREANKIAEAIQSKIMVAGKKVEVIIYGDGAYKDPDTGIYELADPTPVFGSTKGLKERIRKGVKYKFLADKLYKQGKKREEIERYIEEKQGESYSKDNINMEGTTPRKLSYITASLADLVSGSADAGTPIVIVKNLF